MTVGFVVVGAPHLHLFTPAGGLVDVGARTVAHVRSGDLIGGSEGWQPASELRGGARTLDLPGTTWPQRMRRRTAARQGRAAVHAKARS
jgi:hypothetical protein